LRGGTLPNNSPFPSCGHRHPLRINGMRAPCHSSGSQTLLLEEASKHRLYGPRPVSPICRRPARRGLGIQQYTVKVGSVGGTNQQQRRVRRANLSARARCLNEGARFAIGGQPEARGHAGRAPSAPTTRISVPIPRAAAGFPLPNSSPRHSGDTGKECQKLGTGSAALLAGQAGIRPGSLYDEVRSSARPAPADHR